ncbi:MAG TPA: response regulator, partial [Terriglobales bacterium]|nr:response regulator [Terriglobales bacterium]
MPLVLCIDDDKTSLALRKLLLETKGYTVLTATSGVSGIEIVRNMHCDAVVLDFQMPHMDGEQVTRILRRETPWLPIILLSGSGAVPSSLLTMVDEHLPKGSADLLDS